MFRASHSTCCLSLYFSSSPLLPSSLISTIVTLRPSCAKYSHITCNHKNCTPSSVFVDCRSTKTTTSSRLLDVKQRSPWRNQQYLLASIQSGCSVGLICAKFGKVPFSPRQSAGNMSSSSDRGDGSPSDRIRQTPSPPPVVSTQRVVPPPLLLNGLRTGNGTPPISASPADACDKMLMTENSCVSDYRHDVAATAFNFPHEPTVFRPKRVLILNKLTRFEYETRSHSSMTETQLAKEVSCFKTITYWLRCNVTLKCLVEPERFRFTTFKSEARAACQLFKSGTEGVGVSPIEMVFNQIAAPHFA